MPEELSNKRKPELVTPEPTPEVKKVPEAPKEELPVVEKPEIPITPPETPSPSFAPPPGVPKPPAPAQKEPVLAQIEEVLSEDLEEVYAGLPPELKPKFKAKGEEVARTIRFMVASAKVKARRVLKLIVDWLKIIPGVNKFFLEQEAAIKTQKIVQIAKEIKKPQ